MIFQDSCQRGWRLFSIIAAQFTSSELLKPYLFKYLETSAYDKRRAYHGTALVCLHNLRKTSIQVSLCNFQDSCQRGWRLFSIIAAQFTSSELLKPYLFKYLETSAYDKRRAYHGTALVCLHNLRKTFKYGGRRNVPSIEEISAITAGRNSKRQIYRYVQRRFYTKQNKIPYIN